MDKVHQAVDEGWTRQIKKAPSVTPSRTWQWTHGQRQIRQVKTYARPLHQRDLLFVLRNPETIRKSFLFGEKGTKTKADSKNTSSFTLSSNIISLTALEAIAAAPIDACHCRLKVCEIRRAACDAWAFIGAIRPKCHPLADLAKKQSQYSWHCHGSEFCTTTVVA